MWNAWMSNAGDHFDAEGNNSHQRSCTCCYFRVFTAWSPLIKEASSRWFTRMFWDFIYSFFSRRIQHFPNYAWCCQQVGEYLRAIPGLTLSAFEKYWPSSLWYFYIYNFYHEYKVQITHNFGRLDCMDAYTLYYILPGLAV